jgi:hypothetical protein
MGRVLALVAGALVLCLAGLGLAVYLTRDEDNLHVDNLLSEAITQRVTEAPDYGNQLDLRELFLFLQGSRAVRFADYRGSNTFEGFERPFAEFPRERAVFDVRDRVISP